MNINSNELLMLKKIKLAAQEGENTETAKQTVVTEPEQPTQNGLNQLAFQGMKNVATNPQLAQKLGVMKDVEPKQTDSEKEYVAPYQSNIAFQGRAAGAKFNKALLSTLMALMTLGPAATTLTSCTDQYEFNTIQQVEVKIDVNALTALLQQLVDQGVITQTQLETLINEVKILREEVAGLKDANEQLYKKLVEYMANDAVYKEMIIVKLTELCGSEKDANKMLEDLLAAVKDGNITAEEAYNTIIGWLGAISNQLGDILNVLKSIEQKTETLNQTAEDIKKGVGDINEKQDLLISQGNALRDGLNVLAANQEVMIKTIEEIGAENLKGLEDIQKALGMSTAQITAVITHMGYTLAEVQTWSTAKILAALKENTQATKQNGAKLDQILKELKDGRISAEEAADKIIELLGTITNQLAQLIEAQAKAAEDRAKLIELATDIKNLTYVSVTKQDELIAQNDSLLASMNKVIENQEAMTARIEAAINDAKLSNEAKIDELARVIGMSKDQIIGVMINIGYTQAQVEMMTTAQIVKAIKENTQATKQNGVKLQEILDELKSGRIDAKEAADKIINLLGEISAKLDQVLVSMKKAEDDRAKLIEIANDIKNLTYVSVTKQNELIAQNDSLLASMNVAIQNQEAMIQAIENADVNNAARLDELAKAIGMSKDQIIGVMMQIGYTQAQVEMMTTAQIVAAIKENTQATKENGAKLQEILDELKSGKIDAKEAANQIIALLGEINQNILNLTESFNSFVKEYKNDKKQLFAMMGSLVVNNQIQTATLASMEKTQKEMLKKLDGLKASTDELLAIAKDETKFNELIETIKNSQNGGSASIDYERFEQMFDAMGLTIAQVVKMSASEMIQAIENFQNVYIAVEQKQTEELQTINAKLDDIMWADGVNKDEIKAAIAELTDAVNRGNEDVTAKLEELNEAVAKIQAQLDEIKGAINDLATNVTNNLNQYGTRLDKIFGAVDNLESQLATIINNQTLASAQLDVVISKMDDLKAKLEELKGAAGGNGLTKAELEEVLGKEFKGLIDALGLEFDNTNDLLASIDAKMDHLKDHTDLLGKILNKLDGLELSPEQWTKIEELVQNIKFTCDCNCGGANNEGNEDWEGKLDDILGI